MGGNDALRELVDEAHRRNMKIVLDGVFNHTGRGFWAFHHILENGANSPYLDWFHIHDWPLRPYSSNDQHPSNYAGWWGMPALPKFNTANPGVRDYLFSVARYWIDFGVDGWRLDVPADIDDDSFWQSFRQIVKDANPEAYIVGEIWHEAQRWLQGDQFDAVMNYPFTAAALSFLGAEQLNTDWQHSEIQLQALDAAAFHERIERMHGLYDWQVTAAQLNLLDSHDTPRALWMLGGDKIALKLCVLLLMTMPGAPCIYYGDEIGMSSPGDPHCRAAYPWQEPQNQDLELLSHFRSAAQLRRKHAVLSRGSFKAIYAQGQTYAFKRVLNEQEAVVVFNVGHGPTNFNLREIGDWDVLWPSDGALELEPRDGKMGFDLPAQSAVVLLRN